MSDLPKKLPSPPPSGGSGLPVLAVKQALAQLEKRVNNGEKIPNASLIYGLGAACLIVIALYYFFTGAWLTGFLVSVLGIALFGYALHYMRYL